MTLRQALDHLIDRRRGFGWCLRIIDGLVTVYIYSVFKNAVTVDGGGIIHGNATTVGLGTGIVTADDITFANVTRTVNTQNAYARIRVIGERIKTCFSLSFINGTLTEGWTTDEETKYLAGAGSTTDPAKNDRVRSDVRLQHVYTAFIVPKTWDWSTGDPTDDGEAGTNFTANPDVNDDGSVTLSIGASTRHWGHHFLHHLPLLKQVDQGPFGPTKLAQEFEEPFALVLCEQAGGTTPQYQMVHSIYGEIKCRRTPAATRCRLRHGSEVQSRTGWRFVTT